MSKHHRHKSPKTNSPNPNRIVIPPWIEAGLTREIYAAEMLPFIRRVVESVAKSNPGESIKKIDPMLYGQIGFFQGLDTFYAAEEGAIIDHLERGIRWTIHNALLMHDLQAKLLHLSMRHAGSINVMRQLVEGCGHIPVVTDENGEEVAA
ncbi:MAG: hypothetical protein HQL97_01025 [Magnetococcales bacterium]|nr:hypothetical protein [Magnetococcales bacterium]